MTRLILMFVACMLAGSAAPSIAGAQAKASEQQSIELKAKAALDTYVDCLFSRGDLLARGGGSASEVADAALADCGREYDAFRSAIRAYFASGVSRDGQAKAVARADAKVAEYRDDGRRLIISRVLRARKVATPNASNVSSGTGFFCAPGVVATNAHVVEGAKTVEMYLPVQRRTLTLEVLVSDASNPDYS